MKDKSKILKCFNHSHFIKALAAPELFEFKNNAEINDDLFYEELYMECRASLDDIDLEKKPHMLYGKFVTKEQKIGCVLDLMNYIPDSATSIAMEGAYEATVVEEGDTIRIISDFNAYRSEYGANRDNRSMHDPIISFVKRETSISSYIGGSVEDVFKFYGDRVTHTSSICDSVETFDLNNSKTPSLIKTIDEVYPKGLLVRKIKTYSSEELKLLEKEKEQKIDRKLHIDKEQKENLREDLEHQKQKRELKKVKKLVKNNKKSRRG